MLTCTNPLSSSYNGTVDWYGNPHNENEVNIINLFMCKQYDKVRLKDENLNSGDLEIYKFSEPQKVHLGLKK